MGILHFGETMFSISIDGDCEWYAVDSVGQIGFFTSAGSQLIPEYYCSDPEIFSEYARIARHMVEDGGHEFKITKKAGYRYTDWIEMSNRGLYGYDFDLNKESGYELITIPTRPVLVGELAGAWAKNIPYFPGRFGIESSLIPKSGITLWKPKQH